MTYGTFVVSTFEEKFKIKNEWNSIIEPSVLVLNYVCVLTVLLAPTQSQ